MRVFATIHDDNSHSETPQPDPFLVETESNVTLTCHAPKAYEINWYFNSSYQEVPDCTNVETCNLTLRWPVASGNYTCWGYYSSPSAQCFKKVLELKVAVESRVTGIQVLK